VTLNRLNCHEECFLAQINGYLRDTIDPNLLWKSGKGGPANSKTGECGKKCHWGFCSKADGKPGILKNIPKAIPTYDWLGAIDRAVNSAIAIAENQLFQDGNHRTALLAMFDSLHEQGLGIKFDDGNPEVDGFRLYVQLKSLTDPTGKWPAGQPDRVKAEMVKLLKNVVRIRDVPWSERLGLAEFVKTKIPAILNQVGLEYRKLAEISTKMGKAAAQIEARNLKRADQQLYSRVCYYYGDQS